ncbi:MAG: hypothetical protein K8F93_08760, partial [Burkholderiales bacterium]|nr:hypothetical protein [Burkholderiales bacterium]
MSTPAPGAAPKSGLHPGLVVGAIAVVVFGAAGAASYLGLLPGQPKSAEAVPVPSVTTRTTPAPASPVTTASPAQQAGIVADATVAPAPAP